MIKVHAYIAGAVNSSVLHEEMGFGMIFQVCVPQSFRALGLAVLIIQ